MLDDRTETLTALLESDPSHARTQAAVCEATGWTVGQLDYLMAHSPTARDVWRTARAALRAERCARRVCSSCGVERDASEFPRDARDGCGIGRRCLLCHRLLMRVRRAQTG